MQLYCLYCTDEGHCIVTETFDTNWLLFGWCESEINLTIKELTKIEKGVGVELSGCHGSVAELWQPRPDVSWVRLNSFIVLSPCVQSWKPRMHNKIAFVGVFSENKFYSVHEDTTNTNCLLCPMVQVPCL